MLAKLMGRWQDGRSLAAPGVTGNDFNFAKDEQDDLAAMLGAIGAEAEWLAKGDDVRFMNDVALKMQG